MRKILLAFALSLLAGPALAASCPNATAQVKDNANVTSNMALGDDGSGSGNCEATIQIKQGNNTAAVTAGSALKVDGSAVTQPISAASLPLPTGASTAAGLTTINTTLGSPFQAGGSIGNTSFAATQSGTWTVQPGNTPNTTPWLMQIRDAAGNSRGANVNASNQLSVSCDNGCSATTSISGWGGGTLGAMANYGTSPGAVLVPGVNAFVTNTIAANATLQASATTAIGKVDPNTIASWGLAAIGGTTGSPTNALAAGCQYNSSAPTFTSGDVGGVQCDVNGNTKVTVTNANANGQTTASGSSPVVLASNQTAADPCMFQAKTNVAISTASGTTALVTGVSAKKIYVCSLALIVPSAVSVSLAEGSSATCGTSSQAAVIGVATNGTAANGMPLAANGGLTLGNGGGTVAATATAANYLCLFQSGTAQIAGNLTYVQQ